MREAALTFDDGPNPPYTNQIVDILDYYKVPGTFFVVGRYVQQYPHIIKQMHARKHEIGNHSYSHQLIPTIFGTIFDETLETQKAIEDITGPIPKVFRSPFGYSPPWLLKKLSDSGFAIAPTIQATWGHDYFPGMTAEKISKRIIRNIPDSAIILLHDRGTAVNALPSIIEELLKQGYTFKKLSGVSNSRKYRSYFYP